VVILLLEAAYRFAMFDPYGPELRAYNSVEDLATKIPARTVLVMGDSMTAGARSYPALMRGAIPDLRVINAGIPGSGILQANIVAAKRFREFDPDVFLYQITVGNDLLNLRYPIHWRKVSFARNVYWSVVHRLRLIEYLNYRSGQLAFSIRHREFLRDRAAGGPPEPRSCGYDPDEFDPLEYTKRIRIYFQADPGYLEDQVLVRASRERDFERLLDGLQRLLRHCDPESCRSFLLLVPDVRAVHSGPAVGGGKGRGEWGDSHTRWIATDGTLRRSYVRAFTPAQLEAEVVVAGFRLVEWQAGHGLLRPLV
jgi:hypothetical protein